MFRFQHLSTGQMVHRPMIVSRHRSDLELRGPRGGILAGKYNDGTPATRETFARRILAGMETAIAATWWAPTIAHGRTTALCST